MSGAGSWVLARCRGCGAAVRWPTLPFTCPQRRLGDGVDHVLVPVLPDVSTFVDSAHPNPFVRFRTLLSVYALLRRAGLSDGDYQAIAERLDEQVKAVCGRGFVQTPAHAAPELARACGARALWVKDETDQVAESHKARHLMGLAIYLAGVETLTGQGIDAPLAIASCGNAALAAAVVAKAAGRQLEVFIPVQANASVVSSLVDLGVSIDRCPRRAGVPGDPCYHGFQEAVRAGALPFCCQGPDNGLTIDGGQTLIWELVCAMAQASQPLDSLFVQVGGGALASACIQGLRMAVQVGLIEALPRLVAVQTTGCAPLQRAYDRVRADVGERLEAQEARAVLDSAAKHRDGFMWPWEEEPASLAEGILDDETYDWWAVVEGMLESGGGSIIVDDRALKSAKKLADRAAARPVSYTGAAGLAGVLAEPLPQHGLARANVAVLLSGRAR